MVTPNPGLSQRESLNGRPAKLRTLARSSVYPEQTGRGQSLGLSHSGVSQASLSNEQPQLRSYSLALAVARGKA